MVTLNTVVLIMAPIGRCFDLARSVEVHLAGNARQREAALARGGVTSGLIGLGQRVTWRANHFGVWLPLSSEITRMDRPAYFRDEIIRGPFQAMKHDHFFRALSAHETEMRDVFCFAAPLGLLGRIVERTVLCRHMLALLRQRNRVIREIAESSHWSAYLPPACGGGPG